MPAKILQTHGMRTLHAPIKMLEEQGFSAADCLKGTGISEQTLLDTEAQVSLQQELAVYRNVIRLTGDPTIGLAIGGEYHLPTYGVWGYALMAAPTTREAIMMGVRFIALSYTYFYHELTVEGATAVVKMEPLLDCGDCLQLVSDRELSALYLILMELTGSPPPVKQIRLVHSDLKHARTYQNYFGCEVVFGCEYNQFRFASKYLDDKLSQSDKVTASLCAQQCALLMAKLSNQSGFVDEVRQLILSRPGYFPDIDYIAEKLQISSRTLRRRLTAEGSGYNGIINEIRYGLAREYLETTSLLLEEIAGLLGYSDPGNFTHAFKGWCGITPRAYRQSCL